MQGQIGKWTIHCTQYSSRQVKGTWQKSMLQLEFHQLQGERHTLNVGEALPQLGNMEKENMVRKETPETENSETKLFVQTPTKKMKSHRKKIKEKELQQTPL